MPIVGYRAGGVVEAVAHEVTGFLCEPGDLSALNAHLSRLLSEPDLRSSVGRAGRARVLDTFSIEGMTNGNLAVYERVLAQRR